MAQARESLQAGPARWIPSIHPAGLLLAAAFFAAALTPSLVPRTPLLQGVLGGVVAALGYEIGGRLAWLWRFLELPRLGGPRAARLRIGTRVVALCIVAFALARAEAWQNATRRVFGVELGEMPERLALAAVALLTFLALWSAFRAFGLLRRRLDRWVSRVVPPRIALALGFCLAAAAFWALIDGVLVQRGFRAADLSFEAADAFIAPDEAAPADPLKTGSAASLVAWEALGRHGRGFVATAPTAAEIAAFAGPGAMGPVRVYVGRRAAETSRARAELALAELIRQGGFARSVLVLAAPVGTGWMDPGAHDTLDFILGGDVATVAVQYSYLTSVLSLWAHPEYGVEQSRDLFQVIYDHWSAMPEDTRPKLYVHGLSQGAFNSQATLEILDLLADPIDGAMWAGSPFFSAY